LITRIYNGHTGLRSDVSLDLMLGLAGSGVKAAEAESQIRASNAQATPGNSSTPAPARAINTSPDMSHTPAVTLEDVLAERLPDYP
jgi:hypothetical protein